VKKIFIILFSALLLFNSFGYIFVYLQVKNNLKDESLEKLKEYIPEEELEVIIYNSKDSLSDGKIEFIEDDEIKYYDRMYDVYKKVEKSSVIYFYCVGDEKENVLNKAFSTYIKSIISKDTPQPALKNILMIKLSFAIINQTDNLLANKLEQLISYSKLFLTTNYPEVLTPPPRTVTAI
jgi:hypothetical protein